jgi:hypothetical protein
MTPSRRSLAGLRSVVQWCPGEFSPARLSLQQAEDMYATGRVAVHDEGGVCRDGAASQHFDAGVNEWSKTTTGTQDMSRPLMDTTLPRKLSSRVSRGYRSRRIVPVA